MPRVVHFEIQAEHPQRALEFYTKVFGWTSEDWSSFTGGAPYWGLVTGEEGTPGINGAIMGRSGQNPIVGGAVGGAVLTVQVEDYDAVAAKILEAGGTLALPKTALVGMAWQGYFHDTENNVFGIHQPDTEAR
jgi:hypothetical protein